jgi:hypothetical protein
VHQRSTRAHANFSHTPPARCGPRRAPSRRPRSATAPCCKAAGSSIRNVRPRPGCANGRLALQAGKRLVEEVGHVVPREFDPGNPETKAFTLREIPTGGLVILRQRIVAACQRPPAKLCRRVVLIRPLLPTSQRGAPLFSSGGALLFCRTENLNNAGAGMTPFRLGKMLRMRRGFVRNLPLNSGPRIDGALSFGNQLLARPA